MGTKHDDATRAAISESMRLHHALRTPEQKAATAVKQADYPITQMWVSEGPHPGNLGIRLKRDRTVDPNTRIGQTTLAKVQQSSIRRILKDLVATRPELFEEAILAGIMAPPPRSFPYLALAAAYIDGKPVQADPPSEPYVDLTTLTREQLVERAEHLVRRLRPAPSAELPVIDVTTEPEPEHEKTLEELQAELADAQEEVRRANEELRVANMILRIRQGEQ